MKYIQDSPDYGYRFVYKSLLDEGLTIGRETALLDTLVSWVVFESF
jgi:hypothetical protein